MLSLVLLLLVATDTTDITDLPATITYITNLSALLILLTPWYYWLTGTIIDISVDVSDDDSDVIL